MEGHFVTGTPSNWNPNQFGGLSSPSLSLPSMVFRGKVEDENSSEQYWEDYNSSSLMSYGNVGEMNEVCMGSESHQISPPPFIPHEDYYTEENTDEGVDLSLGYQLFQQEMGNFLCDEGNQKQEQNVNNSLDNPNVVVGSCCSMNGESDMSNLTGSPYSGVEIPSHAYDNHFSMVDPAPKFRPITIHFLELGLGFSGGSTDIISPQQLQQLRQVLHDYNHSEKQSGRGTMSGGSVVDISRPSSTIMINLKSLVPSENSCRVNGHRRRPQLSRDKPYRRGRSSHLKRRKSKNIGQIKESNIDRFSSFVMTYGRTEPLQTDPE
ncbi:uncharacterized protein LOC118436525 [Folsomia candida]|nr:uncharacterized protein LOC118436525 [Folsomia candida]